MHTNTNYTHDILNGYADAAGKIDIEYIAHVVQVVCDNDGPQICNEKYNTRRKPRAVAIEWLMYWINSEFKYNSRRGYYATNKQVMQWDKSHAGQLEAVLDKVEAYIIAERNENK